MIKRPPLKDQFPPNPWNYMREHHPEKVLGYVPHFSPVDDQGKYFPYDEFRHRVHKDLDVDLAWAFTKEARTRQQQFLFILGGQGIPVTFVQTTIIQKATTIVGQNTTTAALEWTCKKNGEDQHFQYLLNDLVEDEAISSSQLEGAATTTLVAKEMLKKKREPRSMDEKMILGNFKMMRFAWDHREQELTSNLIKELHYVGVDGIENDRYAPGAFRVSDDVVIADQDDNIVHQPPLAQNIEDQLKELCEWINVNHNDFDSNNYIHPLIKAITIHFSIGYEHPFRDGNGRVARALFYWFMFKNNYGAFRYISISNLLKEAATQYGKSYLYTETDDMDLTYFIDYQCSIITRAVSAFNKHCQKIFAGIESFNKWLWNSGIYGKLSDKQKTVFQVAKCNQITIFTTTNVKENLGCSYNTAASVLNGLCELNLFGKRKEGKEWIFYLLDQDKIQKAWKAPTKKSTNQK